MKMLDEEQPQAQHNQCYLDHSLYDKDSGKPPMNITSAAIRLTDN